MTIVLTEYECDQDDENETQTYVDVYGRKIVKDESVITDSYALEFVEWENWLGMDLAPETIKKFSDLEIVAHCLYEMTFVGYEEEEIQEKFETIKGQTEEFKKLSDEERKENTISLDDLIKQLKKEI